jgi:adenylate cyclase
MNPRARKFLVACVAALLTVVLTQEEILRLGIVQRLELASLDYRFGHRGARLPDSSHVVIVEVSDESFKSLPARWPWPRSYYAHLVRNLKAAGANVVGIDLILTGGDAYSPANDEDMRKAIRETGAVVLAGKMEADREAYKIKSRHENFANLFYPVDSALGLVNIRNDADGVYRRYSPFWERPIADEPETLRVPTFSFAALNKYFNLPHHSVAQNHPDHFAFGGRRIPKHDPSSLLINFYGPSGTFKRVKFVDVIDDETMTTNEEAHLGEEINTFSDSAFGNLHDGTFRNKIVLVGSTNPEDHDLFPVSLAHGEQHGDNLMYGVEIHANVIESVVRGDFLRKQSKLSEILLIVFASLFTFYVISRIRSGKSLRHFMMELVGLLFVLLAIAALAYAAIELFTRKSFVMSAISPMVAVLASYIASTAYHFVTERKQRLLIKNMFSTYVNAAVVDELIANPEKLQLGGARKQLTVLFSDVEGFTTVAERMAPDALVAFLNEYLSAMTEIIFKHTGTLDKFFGDAVIAFWGAPLPQSDHAVRACLTALEMQQRLRELRLKWHVEGKPLVHTRIGINTGEMVVGNFGGTGKFDYTVIGDSVNIASRLEGANKFYRTGTIVSQATYDLVKHLVVGRELDLITVKGRVEPLRIFEVLQSADDGADAVLSKFLAFYSEGMHCSRERRWSDAAGNFREALSVRADDYPAQLHLTRAQQYALNPPPQDWTGVVELVTK